MNHEETAADALTLGEYGRDADVAPSEGASGEPAQFEHAPLRLVGGASLFAGIVLPCLCLLIGFPEAPDWQSGALRDYARLLLSRQSITPMWPLLLYCMICLGYLFRSPEKGAKNVFVRFGVYGGVLIAAEYWLVFQIALLGLDARILLALIASVLAVLMPIGILRLVRWIHAGNRTGVLVGLVLLILISAAVFAEPVFGICLFLLFWCSTPWAVATYLIVSIRLIRGREDARWRFSLLQVFGAVTWLSAHMAAWRLSFVWMLEQYSRLPKDPPQGCFVCTAAAHGHRGVVRSERYVAADGTSFRVNDQLRTLKAFELLLAHVSPRSHRLCRGIYNRVGPWLAAMLFHPLLADAGYIVLKPAEWLARLALALAIPGQRESIDGLYRTGRDKRLESKHS